MNVIVLVSTTIIFLAELITKRNFKESCNTFESFFKGILESVTFVVVLVVATGFFAHVLMDIGVIDDIIDMSKNIVLPSHFMTVVLAFVILEGHL